MSHVEHESAIQEDAPLQHDADDSAAEDAILDSLNDEMRARLEEELAAFTQAEAAKLGLGRDQYTENVNTDFRSEQRTHTTILVRGLTLAHDDLVAAALRGLGYKAELMETPTNAVPALPCAARW